MKAQTLMYDPNADILIMWPFLPLFKYSDQTHTGIIGLAKLQ